MLKLVLSFIKKMYVCKEDLRFKYDKRMSYPNQLKSRKILYNTRQNNVQKMKQKCIKLMLQTKKCIKLMLRNVVNEVFVLNKYKILKSTWLVIQINNVIVNRGSFVNSYIPQLYNSIMGL